MAHGKNINLDEARDIIRAYVDAEVASGRNEKDIVVGHRFDLQLVKNFIAEIDRLRGVGIPIDSIRVYQAKRKRDGMQSEDIDVVLVPTSSNDEDYHRVYDFKKTSTGVSTILGHPTPCPNVCQQKYIHCR